MPSFPSTESATVARAVMERRTSSHGCLSTIVRDDHSSVNVFASEVMRIHMLPDRREGMCGAIKVSVSLAGWGDHGTVRRHINSVLARLGVPFCVGRKDGTCYMYYIERERTRDDDGLLFPVAVMPTTGWVSVPDAVDTSDKTKCVVSRSTRRGEQQ